MDTHLLVKRRSYHHNLMRMDRSAGTPVPTQTCTRAMRGLVRVEASQSCMIMRLGAENRGWGGSSAASGRGRGQRGQLHEGATILKPNDRNYQIFPSKVNSFVNTL